MQYPSRSLGAALVGLAACCCLGQLPSAAAFCGFFVAGSSSPIYNNASQVALLRKGNHTVMTMSNNYKGPPEDFAMVVPVPVVLQKSQVRTLNPKVFAKLDELTAPRLVEYWEQDPCDGGGGMGYLAARSAGGAKRKSAKSDDGDAADYGVKIEAQFAVGEYEILILSAQESTGLEQWLRLQKYNIPQGAAAALAPYIHDQMKFFVAKIDIKKVKRDPHDLVVLSPLQFSFDAAELRLPVRLGLLNSEAHQDLIVYVLHPTRRFEVANYPTVFIPTNLEVVNDVRTHFGAFYAELFDETLRRQNNRAVITEYAWDSASCDPCPTPPLTASELHTLGASRNDAEGSFVMTRLHTRYDRQTLSEDLVFRAARAAVGGRAERDDMGGPIKATLNADDSNSFQGRYIIRHYWGGKATCATPQRGQWGGPPSGRSPAKPAAARDLASMPRGQVQLSAVVKSKVPALGLLGLFKGNKSGVATTPSPPAVPAPAGPGK